MEQLRISIPMIEFCATDTCHQYISSYSFYRVCHYCIHESNPRMSKEMATAALARKPELVHGPALGSSGSRLRKIH